MERTRITGTSAPQQVVAVLRDMIFDGRVAPGSPLREAPLAEEFGVSRNTLREAVRGLVHEGLVRHERNRGAVVVRLAEADARDIYAVRQVLEPTAVAALATASDDALEAVQRSFDDLASAIGSRVWPAVIEADIAFHRSVVGLAGSERLVRCFATIESELAYFLSLIRLREREQDRPQALLDEHEAILRTVLARDAGRARGLIVDHLRFYEARARSEPGHAA